MKHSPISASALNFGTGRQDSMHSAAFGAVRVSTPGDSPSQAPSNAELTSMYTRQFAASKSGGPSGYPALPSSQASVMSQSHTHGLTVLQCARSRGHVDPHVYRDWLIFEERLKQSYRRSQRKKRNYLVQIAAFGILVLYFAWFGVLGTKPYRFTCRLLSAGSAYCIYLIATNLRFLQSVKYTTQCNRALHQFRLRFETLPLYTSHQLMAATTKTSDGAVSEVAAAARDGSSPFSETLSRSLQPKNDAPEAKQLSYLAEPHLSFFPTVPRQLRDGFMEFKATYYRKRDAAKKRMQDRHRRTRQRKDSISVTSQISGDRKSRQQIHRHNSAHVQNSEPVGDHRLVHRTGSAGSAGASALLTSMDSATDDNSSTASMSGALLGTTPTRTPSERAGSRLAYAFTEHDILSSESEAIDDSFVSQL
ncbi:hypothetical protein H4217_001938 [Coemansia sp. RSA 1939]|nr:hypothetical protein H4217_001938 [Coemansia sp. RSA 1939]KAJ2601011.1 hypothetical protein EV177_007045 [Coemansia sp. RSA 1804]KAJ2672696.1 hypothetical protein GGH99_006079 [Coemansia sp. RSA 1285]